jgi:hypothetical protein
MRAWIIIDGEKTGPFEISHVARQIEEGILKGDTYGWVEGMKQWQPLETISHFTAACQNPIKLDLPATAAAETSSAQFPHANTWQIPETSVQEKTMQLVRRFFARWFDMLLWSSSYTCAIHLSGGNLKELMMNFWFNYIMMCVWIILEAAMLHAWGTTPGKALLGLSVARVDGERLPVGISLLRSIRVYLMGMGMSHPLLLPLCHGFSWWFVRKYGAALWDGASGIRITMKPIRALRWVWYAMAVFMIMNVSGMILESVSRELFREMCPEQSQWLDPTTPPSPSAQ